MRNCEKQQLPNETRALILKTDLPRERREFNIESSRALIDINIFIWPALFKSRFMIWHGNISLLIIERHYSKIYVLT